MSTYGILTICFSFSLCGHLLDLYHFIKERLTKRRKEEEEGAYDIEREDNVLLQGKKV